MVENATQLSLKWNHFQENFTSQFGALKEEEQFVDVTFSCQNKLLRAHKVVLSASSPYLTQLFKENPCKHPVLILDDVPYSHLESLLSFIYTGAVNINEAELSSFLESANLLQIRGLSENIPLNKQTDSTCTTNCVESNSRKRTWDTTAIQTNSKKFVSKCDISKKPIKQENEVAMMDKHTNLLKIIAEEVDVKPHFGSTPGEVVSELASLSCVGVGVSDGNLEGQFNPNHPMPMMMQITPEQVALSDADYTPVDGRRRHSLDPRPCPICNRLYSNLSNLRQHLRLIHNPTVVTCKLCMKSFKTDLYLRRHLISYHDMNLSMEQGAIPDPHHDPIKPVLLVKPNQINQTILMQ